MSVVPTLNAKYLRTLAPRLAFEIVFAVFTFYAARPAFASLHLPLQDVPQHMAAISVLKRYAFDGGLRAYFELTLSRTQYLLVYALGVPLSWAFGVEYATRLLVALTVIATPYALRFTLRKTGGDERMASLAWPFLWNPQMLLGFLNYLLGIPIALLGIGLFADRTLRRGRGRQILLAVITLAAFYSHLIPYGLLGLGVLLQLDAGDITVAVRTAMDADPSAAPTARLFSAARAAARAVPAQLLRWMRELLFLVPSFFALLVWVLRSPARDAQVRAGGVGQTIVLTWPDRLALPGEFRDTVLLLQGESGSRAFLAWGLALLVALALSRAPQRPAVDATAPDAVGVSDANARARIAWLPVACAVLYIATPASYGWIWPIHTRFAVAAVLLLPLGFARTRHHVLAWAVMLALGMTSMHISRDLSANFQRWDTEELGDLDAALAHAHPGRRLIALVPAIRSQYVPSNVPLIHAAAYYQVRGGHVATFSFVDFPQSPFRYREDGPRPPRLRPRWEWETSLREADPTFTYYDYVLARAGYADEAGRMPERYVQTYAGRQWNLYERRR